MKKKLGKIHQKFFRSEFFKIFDIIKYKTAIVLLSLGYKFFYYLELKKTRLFVDGYKKIVKNKKKSVMVLANGPSVGDLDLIKIKKLCDEKGFDIIAINSYISKSSNLLKPTFAVFCDNVHFLGGDNQYTKDINTCIDLDIPYFVPAKYSKSMKGRSYGFCTICNINSENTSDVTKPAGFYGVTAFYALSLAKMLCYDDIYICGFDNSYFKDFKVKDNGEMIIQHRHYYDGNNNIEVPCLYERTSDFFFDTYRHFFYLEKIANNTNIKNIAKQSFLSTIKKELTLDVYKM